MERVETFGRDHPDELALVQRCFRGGPASSQDDKDALSAWVTSMVMGTRREENDMADCPIPQCAARGKELGHRGHHFKYMPGESERVPQIITGAMAAEAAASVALDGETQSVEAQNFPPTDDPSYGVAGAMTILEEAQSLVYGDRMKDYGDPNKSVRTISELWNAYLRGAGVIGREDEGMSPADACQLLLLLKVSRFATGGAKRDTVVDQAGYAAVTARAIGID